MFTGGASAVCMLAGPASPVGGTDAATFGAVSLLSTAGGAETGAACHSIETLRYRAYLMRAESRLLYALQGSYERVSRPLCGGS